VVTHLKVVYEGRKEGRKKVENKERERAQSRECVSILIIFIAVIVREKERVCV
jgi:hypothetical protein